MTQVVESNTKIRILDEAERLFAERGFEATSLREITAAANVNLAAVNYHFHSKDELIRAVVARRIEPLNRKRLAMLEEVMNKPSLETVMHAFYAPVVEMHRDPTCRFPPLMGRIFAEPGPVRKFFLEQMSPTARRFTEVLQGLLPGLPPKVLFWRVHFSVSILAFTMAGAHVLDALSKGTCDPTDVEDTTRRMVEYACAGLRAPLHGDSCFEKQ